MAGFRQVHQFHPSTAAGDAITGDMLEIQRVLRQSGIESQIFAQHVAPGLEKAIRPVSAYSGNADSLLLVHHSMGFDGFEGIVGLPGRKILRFHNITPSHFLPAPSLMRYAELGRRQLRQYAQHIELAIAVSEYNRQDLIAAGYRYTCTLPILFRPDSLLALKPDPQQMRALGQHVNLLFVGRICPNKKQNDLISIFDAYYHGYNPQARLLLIGSWEGTEMYAEQLRSQIKSAGLEQAVWIPGKIPAATLAAAYRRSTALVCASEHEGFCVPLLEAMAFDLPVVAYRAAAVPETLGPAGILLENKDPEMWCEVIEEVRRNEPFRAGILQGQRARLAELRVEKSGSRLLELLSGLSLGPLRTSKPTLQIQGPFETSYSLAVINRGLALALDEEGAFDVSIHCTEGPGDYSPKSEDLADKPRARWLWQKAGMLSQEPDVVIRDLYPPRVHDMPGQLRLLYFFWEDSRINPDWAAMFNAHLDAVLVPSRHVEQVLRASGVTIPLMLLHPGIEERHFTPAARPPADKRFTFLHISSGFPRKGIDLILEAFFTGFTRADDVALVLKTFPNIHNDVAQQLAHWRAQKPDAPECLHIDRDLEAEALAQLYHSAGCAVYPSRAEGFGLPIAEAMARQIPVITTAYGGQMDFCNKENAFLLDYRLVPSSSHLNVAGAQWAEPDVEQLRSHMRFIFENRGSSAVGSRAEAGFRTVHEHLRWRSAARELARLGSEVGTSYAKKPRLAMVTSWDSRCGIAEYTRYLLDAVAEHRPGIEVEVLSSPGEGMWGRTLAPAKVCWTGSDDSLEKLRSELARGNYDVVHFQFNFGFFDVQRLANILYELKQRGKIVFITFHATADTKVNGQRVSLQAIAEPLRNVNAVFVHNPADQKRLAEFGVSGNVHLIRHGNILFPEEDSALRRELGIPFEPVIGTFGFLLPHKGILELLQAVHILRREFPKIGLLAQCALHHDPSSRDFEQKVQDHIRNLGLSSSVLLSTEFLAPEEAILFLQMADVMVLPYGATTESSSAAVRFALASGRPVITTQQPIFEDVREATHQVPENEPAVLAAAIRSVITDGELAERLGERVRQYAREGSWPNVASAYLAQLGRFVGFAVAPPKDVTQHGQVAG
ncbi:MAG TPA: glycosyltransferase [Terriglobales bacterium]|nr:glycosyltransferase [Terriglobales bacterium]